MLDEKRIIKFRARHKNTKQWYYGIDDAGLIIEYNIPLFHFWKEIEDGILDRETLGQFTNSHDKNRKEYYKGDIVKRKKEIGHIVWCNELLDWCVKIANEDLDYVKKGEHMELWQFRGSGEIIGNIHDNPELL